MSTSAIKTYEAFRASMIAKTDDWQRMLAEEVSLIGPLAQVKGKAAFIEINAPFFASIIESEIKQLETLGNYVITQIWTKVATPGGEELTLHVSEWYEIVEDKIQSLHVYFDTYEFRKAMGMG